jgi:hypothetical protein
MKPYVGVRILLNTFFVSKEVFLIPSCICTNMLDKYFINDLDPDRWMFLAASWGLN